MQDLFSIELPGACPTSPGHCSIRRNELVIQQDLLLRAEGQSARINEC